ncbi:MAG TPA: hypothetical protein VIZ62_11235 [Nitrososphaeraceae archaeon]
MEGKLNYEVAEGHRKEIKPSSTTLFPLTFRNEISLKDGSSSSCISSLLTSSLLVHYQIIISAFPIPI